MSRIIKLKAMDGTPIEFADHVVGQGTMKDVYFSPDRSYVVGMFRDKQTPESRDRLVTIAGTFRERIFNQAGGDYWASLYCWPTAVVEWEGRLGVVAPTYQRQFYFEHGSVRGDFLGIRGKEKEGKWFASASNQNRFLDPRERGDWRNYLRIGLLISRAVRRMHAAGLAHSDLSYKNVLVDPVGGNAAVIDIDGLVVPGKYPPDVVGTPDFIAPEVVMTSHLARNDPKRHLPSIQTDRHALSVLIYMYLLYRHPLRGSKIHDMDPQQDEMLGMGERALFVEDPTNSTNRIRKESARPQDLPWADTALLPYTLTGPYLSPLFHRAFTEGLRTPTQRPTADEWETALVKTVDLLQPCTNPSCTQKWYVFDNSHRPACPFCHTPHRGSLPVLNLYSSRREGSFKPDNHRLMVYTNQSMFPWHSSRNIFPNERLTPPQRKRVGYFVNHNAVWYLVNESMTDLMEVATRTHYPPGTRVELKEGTQLLLSREEGGRLVVVQMAAGQ